MSTLPLIANHRGDGHLAVHRGRALRVPQFIGAAHALAARLPAGEPVLLLCEDRVAFALGFAATLLRGGTAVLPPSRAPQAIERIAKAGAVARALVDARSERPLMREIVVDPWCAGPAVAHVPQIPGDHVAAIVHTSGTTGAAQPHPKTWSSLVRGARALRERIGFAGGASIVGAVPPQHMWGLEATIMLALQGGGIVHASTPLLPGDIVAAMADVSAPRWLVTTPLHLRSWVRAGVHLPPLAGVLSAASPLHRPLALQVEAAFDAPVVEIYGSTETGVIGTRRPARDDAFVPLPGVRIQHGDEGLVVHGGHVDCPLILGDQGIVHDDGSVTLTGRDADLVKIGGKRASLAMLDRELSSIEGVVDGAFVVVDDAVAGQRLAAVVVAPQASVPALVAALRERIDPVFMPRPLRVVAALPRSAMGKLSAAALREVVDTRAAPRGASPNADSHVCQAVVPAAHPALPGHFPGRPIVPAAWILTLVAQTCRDAWACPATSLHLQRARFRAPLVPDTTVRIALQRRDDRSIAFALTHGETRIADGVFVIAERVP